MSWERASRPEGVNHSLVTDSAPQLLADIVVLDDSAVLLVRPAHPSDGLEGWRLPGDGLRHGEHPEACVRRALRDQVGMEPEIVALADVESLDGEQWQMVFHYRCDADRRPQPGPSISEARFFQLEHLPAMARGPRERDAIYRVVIGG